MKKTIGRKLAAALLGSVALMAGTASQAHVTDIAWNAELDGSVSFYALSYHSLSASLDNFTANPAGFVINGNNVTFDLGSVVGLSGCNGPGGLASGSCDATWNSIGLDGAVHASGWGNSNYRKMASLNLDTAELAAVGIFGGSNSVLFTTFANNADWAGLTFPSGTVPIQINVIETPEPMALGLFGLGLAGLGFARRRQRREA